MPTPCYLLLLVLTFFGACPGQAQQMLAAPDSAAVAPATPAPGNVDIIVRTNGTELAGRVLGLTPQLVRYLPPAAAVPLTIAADTLHLAAAEVLLIRYANGTQNLLRPAEDSASVVPALVGLSRKQRYERGRQDGRLYYQPAKGALWGTFASTAVAGPVGLVVGTAVAATPPPRQHLRTSDPTLLADPAYYAGYRRQAHNRKIGKAAVGLGAGTVTFAFIYTVVAVIVSASLLNGNFLHMY